MYNQNPNSKSQESTPSENQYELTPETEGIDLPAMSLLPTRRLEGDSEIFPAGFILRREYTPCGKKSCTSEPDEHGPYYVSYRLGENRNISAIFHGEERPSIEEWWTPESAKSYLDTNLRSIKEQLFSCPTETVKDLEEATVTKGLDELEDISNQMGLYPQNDEAQAISSELNLVLKEFDHRIEEAVNNRFEHLVVKRQLSGTNSEEDLELARLDDWLNLYRQQ